MKKYNQAPLPFMGQKRKFLKQFREKLHKCPSHATYVDLFGGSGLLSRTVKDYYPDARVVYNDFDNYRSRLEVIEKTNTLVADIRVLVASCPKEKMLPPDVCAQILDRIRTDEKEYSVDYITLSSNLLFSMNYVTNFAALKKESMYNCVRLSDYEATGYLKDLEVVSMNYKSLFDLYKNEKEVIFLVDPPYLSTEVGSYKGNYWKLADYLDVLTVLNNHAYFYFTSNKSHILELCNWMESKTNYQNPFNNAVVTTTYQQVNYSSSYTDIMLFRGQNIG